MTIDEIKKLGLVGAWFQDVKISGRFHDNGKTYQFKDLLASPATIDFSRDWGGGPAIKFSFDEQAWPFEPGVIPDKVWVLVEDIESIEIVFDERKGIQHERSS